MSFIDEIKNRAKKDIKTIVLPEASDLRKIIILIYQMQKLLILRIQTNMIFM